MILKFVTFTDSQNTNSIQYIRSIQSLLCLSMRLVMKVIRNNHIYHIDCISSYSSTIVTIVIYCYHNYLYVVLRRMVLSDHHLSTILSHSCRYYASSWFCINRLFDVHAYMDVCCSLLFVLPIQSTMTDINHGDRSPLDMMNSNSYDTQNIGCELSILSMANCSSFLRLMPSYTVPILVDLLISIVHSANQLILCIEQWKPNLNINRPNM